MIVFGHIFVEIHYVSPFTLHNGALSLPPLGHGCEEEGICSLATACLFEALGSYNSVFNQALPRSIATAPILWTITHDANTTEEIVQFIEASLPGVRFLSHVQTSGTFLSPEDGEMARLAFDLCIHPVSTAMEESYAEDADQIVHYGSLVGLDLDMLSRSLAFIERDQERNQSWKHLLPPPVLLDRVRSLEERFGFFTGRNNSLRKVVGRFRNPITNDAKDGEMQEVGNTPEKGFKSHLAARAQLDRIISPEHTTTSGTNKSAPLDETTTDYGDVNLKIVDLGNACYTYKHFTDDIQTRQYRAPEVILGAEYDTSADIWSLACIIFELLVGDLMFDPQAGKVE